ncbi:hypothetical protein EMIHUDRAFT_95369 [Emiliania huxleyi CCMP1516]|uniref:EF-hand domain-containing protein n=2 Tax=Emiliania huxleyi TaxID=2903 RepID=A0A0D3JGU1_EMIH1|nr:hypothetical protein EMIHUDRAFT_95369 [Emiliania huxleyi CCMP1516]EOD22726.1 hypothetical protein EMIHUDRAFT_95369 [Emiliania huxleyi CCMP1516]|mmetsp:Transcript_9299/g.29790  ORF Transcript_9299/g.29790 Transcript_9299/m.29790 type:complete len:230 (-) Transcript_9299:435-1124(-)|eukprot:XP_005775155.1 hypothetical protein EMIHUDRAFT_95369 [Emiliania huxleyi CCMP1516]
MADASSRASFSDTWASKLYRATDLDDSNAVEVDEILLLGQALGYYWGSWEPSAVLELLGQDASTPALSTLSHEEFVRFISLACDEAEVPPERDAKVESLVEAGERRRQLLDPFSETRIEAAFDAIDLDDSGAIDMDELLHFARASGLDWDAEACARLLGKMGTDESISRDDFRNFFKTVGLHGAPEAVAAFIAVGSGVKSRLSRQCSGEVVPGSPQQVMSKGGGGFVGL